MRAGCEPIEAGNVPEAAELGKPGKGGAPRGGLEGRGRGESAMAERAEGEHPIWRTGWA